MVTTLFSSDLFLCVIVIATLGGAAIFTEVLKNISLCNKVLPLCLLLLLRVLSHHNWVYSARKTPVGGAAITALHYKCDKMPHYITCLSAEFFKKYCCVGFFCLIFFILTLLLLLFYSRVISLLYSLFLFFIYYSN